MIFFVSMNYIQDPLPCLQSAWETGSVLAEDTADTSRMVTSRAVVALEKRTLPRTYQIRNWRKAPSPVRFIVSPREFTAGPVWLPELYRALEQHPRSYRRKDAGGNTHFLIGELSHTREHISYLTEIQNRVLSHILLTSSEREAFLRTRFFTVTALRNPQQSGARFLYHALPTAGAVQDHLMDVLGFTF